MKRLHVHVGVADLDQSIRFYSTMFGAAPSVTKPDYAKWMLDDPRVNFAISHRPGAAKLDHLGIQAETADELGEIAGRLKAAEQEVFEQKDAACCYVKSDKAWVADPTGIAWETFHTSGAITTYGEDRAQRATETAAPDGAACCAPAMDAQLATKEAAAAIKQRASCCGPKVTTGCS